MVGEHAPISSVDNLTNALNDVRRRLAEVERTAQRRVGGIVAQPFTTLLSSTGFAGTAVAMLSITQSLVPKQFVKCDAMMRVSATAGATGFVRTRLDVLKPDASTTTLLTADCEPSAVEGGTAVDQLVSYLFPAFHATLKGSHVFTLYMSTVSGVGTWSANTNSSILRAEVTAPAG